MTGIPTHCPKCGFLLEGTALTCPNCGTNGLVIGKIENLGDARIPGAMRIECSTDSLLRIAIALERTASALEELLYMKRGVCD